MTTSCEMDYKCNAYCGYYGCENERYGFCTILKKKEPFNNGKRLKSTVFFSFLNDTRLKGIIQDFTIIKLNFGQFFHVMLFRDQFH